MDITLSANRPAAHHGAQVTKALQGLTRVTLEVQPDTSPLPVDPRPAALGTRREPYNSTPVGVSSIFLAPRTRDAPPWGVRVWRA